MEGRFEVEVKCPIVISDDRGTIEAAVRTVCERIENAGAEPKGERSQSDLYLNHPCRDFARSDESVRIRAEVGSGSANLKVTYKGPKVSDRSKARPEYEVALAEGTDAGTILSLFKAIGFTEALRIEKLRRIYILKGIELSVDSVKGLGVFVEAEKVASTVSEAESEIIALMDSLGFSGRERRSYLELILEG